jgi:quinol monooxygenase YgiN
MAEQQMIMEQRVSFTEGRLDRAAVVVGDLSKRLGSLEHRLRPGSNITDEQAAEISQKVKALAALLQEQRPGQNYYQGIFGELYRKYGVTSYKLIRQEQYPDVLAFLDEWREQALEAYEEE